MSYLDIYDINGSGDSLKVCAKNNKVVVILTAILIFILLIVIIVLAVSKKDKCPPEDCNKHHHNTHTEINTEMTSQDSGVTVESGDNINSNTEEVSSSNTSTFNNIEPLSPELFSNDLPSDVQNKKITLDNEVDYNEVLQEMSLDQGVISQHKEYVNDRNKITSTASFVPSRSDTQDIVTSWGLTKSKYVNIDPSAREVPSQDPEQGSKPITLKWN